MKDNTAGLDKRSNPVDIAELPERLPAEAVPVRLAARTLAIAALEAGRRQAMVLPEGAPTMI